MKKLSIYLMLLFAAFLFASCGEEEEVVAEKENVSYYGETELAFTNAAVGSAGEDEGYFYTSLFLSDIKLNERLENLGTGDSFIGIFFASKSEHPEAIEYAEIKSTSTSSDENMFEGGNLVYKYDENDPGASLNVEAGTINLIEYDFSAKTIELEYEFQLEDGKTLKGYYKGSFKFIGEIG